MSLQDYQKNIQLKKTEKFEKRKLERKSSVEEIFFIFEKTLENWLPIKIFNVLIQQNPQSIITKKDVNNIYKGNVRILPTEVDNEKYKLYLELREKIYEKHKKEKELKKENKL